jgi:SepF-like predicted cell division protein (DUF552 family)
MSFSFYDAVKFQWSGLAWNDGNWETLKLLNTKYTLERDRLPSLTEVFRKSKKGPKETTVKAEPPKTYLRAMPLRDLSDLDTIKNEVKSGNIIILRITPLANKSIDDVKQAVDQLTEFATSISGDIARLGEERVVICPPNVRIWRDKVPVASEPVPTAA